MFGRYSLDEPGLILADQGATLQDYLAKVPTPTFMPDADNVIPIVDGDWFEDDIVARFRQFLRVAFGEQHFEENLRFVTESLGVKDLRDYFVKSFYKDHVQRYKKRPIYWLFSSPKGSFNALIYMHRYTPSTVSTVLNEYLREFKAKLEASLQQQERLAAGGGTPAAGGSAEGSRPAPQGAAGARRVRARRALPVGVAADRDRPRRRREGELPEVRCRAEEDPRPGGERMSDVATVQPASGAPLRRPPGRVLARPGGPVRRRSRQPRPAGRADDPRRQRRVRASRTGCCTTSPTSKFLVYRSGQVPAGHRQLAARSGVGLRRLHRRPHARWSPRTSGSPPRASTRSSQAHEKFFNAAKRVQSLKALLTPEDDAARLRAKMSAVVLGQKEHSLLEITRTLLVENAKGQRTKYDALVDYGLDDFYWRGVASIYGYESSVAEHR